MSKINWSSTRYKLRLQVTLDWEKYKKGGLTLPPVELGRCKEWRFEIATDQKSANFLATWERRMVNSSIKLMDVTATIQPYVLK